MVWWIDNYSSRSFKRGTHMGFQRVHDRIYPSINIMFNCHNKVYEAHDIYMLKTAGVNIVNVDLTMHDKEYFDAVKAAILGSEKMPAKYPSPYYKPVALSIIISVNGPHDVDERVDILILKDVTIAAQIHEFRKQNANFSSMPILLWLSTFEIEDLNELIKISGGVVVDTMNITEESDYNVTVGSYYHTLQLCREAFKPVFQVQATLATDYYEETATDLQMLSIANKLVQDRVSGVIVFDQDASGPLPIDALRSFAEATDIAERDVNAFKDYFNMSFRIKTPIIPPHATALSASLAALQCGASAILVLTTTGASARLFSSSLPPCHVLAITTRETSARRLHLYKKIIPLFYEYPRADNWQEELRNRISFGTQMALETGLCRAGAKLVVLAQSEENTGYCNSIQIIRIPFRCN